MAKSKTTRGKGVRGAKKGGKKAAKAARSTGATRSSKKAAPKAGARKSAPKAAKKSAKPAGKKAAKPAAKRASAPKSRIPLPKVASAKKAARPGRAPALDRPRRTVADTEPAGIPSALDLDRKPSAARSGRRELIVKLDKHTSTGPALTGGDIDADWESAESVGDEAPGGDNPTPDQDVVDDIGRALGVEYDDDEELQGGDEIIERDQHRWELDPASKDDFDEEE